MRNNLHIFATRLQRESRLLKETHYCLSRGIFDQIVVQGIWDEGLPYREVTDFGLDIRRMVPMIRRSRFMPEFLRRVLMVLNYFQYALHCMFLSRNLRPSHISCHMLMMLPIAWLSCLVSGGTLVYVPHELEAHRSGKWGFSLRLQALVERWFIRKAKDVVVVCDPIADWYRQTYSLSNVSVVRNVPTRRAVQLKQIPEAPFRQKFSIPETALLFIYQGLLGAGRGTQQLIECFAGLDPRRFHIVFMGYGEGSIQAKVDAAVLRYPNIHYQSAVPMDMIISYTAGADIGIFISERPSISYRYSLPNKFYEYAHAGLPILISDNLAYLTDLVKQGQLGWSVPLDTLQTAIEKVAQAQLSYYRTRTRAFARSAIWEVDAQVFDRIYGPKSPPS